MLSGIMMILGVIKVAADYKSGFTRKMKGLISLIFSFLAYPVLAPLVRGMVYRTELITYLNDWNLQFLEIFSTDLDGNVMQNDIVTNFIASNLEAVTQIEIKLFCLIGTVFVSSIILAIIFKFTDLTNKIPFAAQMNHVLGGLVGLAEYAFYVCVILAFLHAICIYTENTVIMGLLENDNILSYMYANNPLVKILFYEGA